MGRKDPMLWDSEPRTLLKHQAYRRYLGCWMGKVCQRFPAATVVDAFAGPGVYRDGPDGSPVVVAKTFLGHTHRRRFNTLRLLCVEERPDRRDHLAGVLKDLAAPRGLEVNVLPAGRALDRFAEVDAMAHQGRGTVPVLWLLDPFNHGGVPFELVRSCLRRSGDEVLVTLFVNEIYRFLEDDSKSHAFDRLFGGGHWRDALQAAGEHARKRVLMEAYQRSLEGVSGVMAKRWEIACGNESARYALMFATHHPSGLDCFNDAVWAMDPHRGRGVSEKTMGAPTLLDNDPIVAPLRTWALTQTGRSVSFSELSEQTTKLGYRDTHLRRVLDELADEGRVAREFPLQAGSRWPRNCAVRFYTASEEATGRSIAG